MKNVTITIDLKSLCIGALGVLCVVSLSNFNNAGEKQNDVADEVHRYQAVTGEKGTVILDTKTGKYIFENTSIGKPRWFEGDFATEQARK